MKFPDLVLVACEGSCEVFSSGVIYEDENENDSEKDEEREEEKDDEGEGADEFVNCGVGSDNHKGGEVGLKEEWGVHYQ